MQISLEAGVSVLTVFLQGLLSFFSPCTLPLVPLYISYLAGGGKTIDENGRIYYPRKQVMINTIFFVIGISFTFFLLGVGFSVLGRFFNTNKYWFTVISGGIMILFGLYQLGVFGRFRFVEREHRMALNPGRWAMNPITAWILGFTFSFAWTPCVGPTLSSVLLMVSSAQSNVTGFLFIGVYTIGFIIPFLLVGLFTGTVLDVFKKHQNIVKYTVKIGAVLLILMGIMTATGFMNGVNGYFASISNKGNAANTEKQTDKSEIQSAKPSQSSTDAPTKAPSKKIIPAVQFTLADQYGNIHNMSDYLGKVVFINFWTTWCGYCKQEMPDIERLYEEYGSNAQDVVILGAANPSSDKYPNNADVSKDEINKFISDNNYTFPTVIDETGELFQAYGIGSFPTTMIIGKDGNILGYVPGAMSLNDMKSVVEQALNY